MVRVGPRILNGLNRVFGGRYLSIHQDRSQNRQKPSRVYIITVIGRSEVNDTSVLHELSGYPQAILPSYPQFERLSMTKTPSIITARSLKVVRISYTHMVRWFVIACFMLLVVDSCQPSPAPAIVMEGRAVSSWPTPPPTTHQPVPLFGVSGIIYLTSTHSRRSFFKQERNFFY